MTQRQRQQISYEPRLRLIAFRPQRKKPINSASRPRRRHDLPIAADETFRNLLRDARIMHSLVDLIPDQAVSIERKL